MRRDIFGVGIQRAALISGVLLLLLTGPGFALGFSGYEAFIGTPNSAGTGRNGNLFAGWTDSAPIASGWQRPTLASNEGGIVAGSVNYIGRPGFRRCATICPSTSGTNATNGRGSRPALRPVATSDRLRADSWSGPWVRGGRSLVADAQRVWPRSRQTYETKTEI